MKRRTSATTSCDEEKEVIDDASGKITGAHELWAHIWQLRLNKGLDRRDIAKEIRSHSNVYSSRNDLQHVRWVDAFAFYSHNTPEWGPQDDSGMLARYRLLLGRLKPHPSQAAAPLKSDAQARPSNQPYTPVSKTNSEKHSEDGALFQEAAPPSRTSDPKLATVDRTVAAKTSPAQDIPAAIRSVPTESTASKRMNRVDASEDRNAPRMKKAKVSDKKISIQDVSISDDSFKAPLDDIQDKNGAYKQSVDVKDCQIAALADGAAE